ncbi:uncharacterized protein V1518DRAFT_420831 [Limtongia smithiae]|uniref:uncharacterized protein n=1 Tax=Limtongia smithiae TaxID=1125753 RepID=UPI0034CF3CC4
MAFVIKFFMLPICCTLVLVSVFCMPLFAFSLFLILHLHTPHVHFNLDPVFLSLVFSLFLPRCSCFRRLIPHHL